MTSATDNRTTKLDSCEVVRLDGVEVQQNGIIRDNRGWIIGRADTEWMRYQWRMMMSGVCPCCGRRVDEPKGELKGGV